VSTATNAGRKVAGKLGDAARHHGLWKAPAVVTAVAMVIVLMVRDPQATPWSWAVVRGFAGNAVDLALFVASALLFRKAARSEG